MRGFFMLMLAAVAVVTGVVALLGRLIKRRETLDWEEAPKPGKVAVIDGEPIHYIEQGSGPAAILIHGFGGQTYSYRYLLPELARDHRVVAVDLLGFGYSGRAKDADYSLTAQARRVLRLMDQLKIERAAVVGHSMGGEVAMRMAAKAPERVERLVLAASVSGDRIPTLPPTPLLKPFLPVMARLTGRLLLRRAVADPAHFTPEVREAYLAPTRIRGSVDALYKMLKDGRKDKKIEYSRIRQPALILWASAEKVVPGWALRRLRKHLPQAQVVTIESAGHLLLEERPNQSNAAIHRFLDARISEVHPADFVPVEALTVDGGPVQA